MASWGGYSGRRETIGTPDNMQTVAAWPDGGCWRSGPGKFAADTLGETCGPYVLLLDGTVFNRAELMRETGRSTWAETVIALYERDGDGWMKNLRGAFCGLLYDTRCAKLLLYTNQIGDKKIFFCQRDGELYFSTDLAALTAMLRRCGVKPSLDVNSAYSLLSYGFMLEDNTLLQEVKRLKAGQFLTRQDDGRIALADYYRLDNTHPRRIAFDDAVEELDVQFRRAVKREYDQDREYGFRHLAGLSGGLDARMALWVARDLGYDPIVSYTIGQTGCEDDRVAKQMAAYLHTEHFFKSLDHGLFLYELEKTTAINPGMCLYYGMAHIYSVLRNLNMAEFGLDHSGQLGDVVIGSFIKKYTPGQPLPVHIGGTYSAGLSDKVQCHYDGFANQELFLMQTRAFSGCLQGNHTSQHFGTEVGSPFCDVDLLDFCFSLPLEYRVGHRLYFAWVRKKYPAAADFKWISQNRFINDGPLMNFIHKFPRRAKNQLLRLAGQPMIGSTFSRQHMNPLDLWYQDNPQLRKFIDGYFAQNQDRLAGAPELLADCRTQFAGLAVAKVQVLSLLESVRQLLPE